MIEVKEAALKAFDHVAEMETVARQGVTPEGGSASRRSLPIKNVKA